MIGPIFPRKPRSSVTVAVSLWALCVTEEPPVEEQLVEEQLAEDLRPVPVRGGRKRKRYAEHGRANSPDGDDVAAVPLPAAVAAPLVAPVVVPLAAPVAAAALGAAAGLEARFARFTPVCVADGPRRLARTWGGGKGGQCRSKPCGEDGLCKVHHWCRCHRLAIGETPPAKLANLKCSRSALMLRFEEKTCVRCIIMKAHHSWHRTGLWQNCPLRVRSLVQKPGVLGIDVSL